jgi:cytochrome bd-type quinol oxidase subunit 2
MRGTVRALGRLPIVAQFLLVPLPAVLAMIAYGGWRWTQADWGPLTARSHEYHVLGWMVLPLGIIAAGLFALAVGRGVKGHRTRWLLSATALIVFVILALILSPWPDVSACACDGG